MNSLEYEALAAACWRFLVLDIEPAVLVSSFSQHDPEDTTTLAAPNAIQIGPIDV